MLTVSVAQTILDVLGQMRTDGEIFTAFDVTKKVRIDLSNGADIPHRDVRVVVHNEFATGAMLGYSQLAGVELNVSGNPQVIVYYPDGTDPYDHPLAMQPAPAGVAPDPDDDDDSSTDTTSTDTTSTVKQGGADLQDDGSIICSFTSEGRINIPKSLLRKVNPTGGSYDFTTGRGDFVRGTNGDGRIRLRKSELAVFGIDTDTVRLSADETTDKISVSNVIDDADDSDDQPSLLDLPEGRAFISLPFFPKSPEKEKLFPKNKKEQKMGMWLFKMLDAEPHHYRISNDINRLKRFVKREYGYHCKKQDSTLWWVYDKEGDERGYISIVGVV